jgi:hypothetical protein
MWGVVIMVNYQLEKKKVTLKDGGNFYKWN